RSAVRRRVDATWAQRARGRAPAAPAALATTGLPSAIASIRDAPERLGITTSRALSTLAASLRAPRKRTRAASPWARTTAWRRSGRSGRGGDLQSAARTASPSAFCRSPTENGLRRKDRKSVVEGRGGQG